MKYNLEEARSFLDLQPSQAPVWSVLQEVYLSIQPVLDVPGSLKGCAAGHLYEILVCSVQVCCGGV